MRSTTSSACFFFLACCCQVSIGQFETSIAPRLSISSDEKWLAVASHDEVVVWDMTKSKVDSRLPLSETVKSLKFAPTSKNIFVGIEEPRADASKPCTFRLELWSHDKTGWSRAWSVRQDGSVEGLDVSPDGEHVAVCTCYASCDIRRTADGVLWASYRNLGNPMNSCRLTRDARKVLVTGQYFQIWETFRDDLDPQRELDPKTRMGEQKISEVDARCCLAQLGGQAGPVTISPDGTRVYSIGAFRNEDHGRSHSFVEVDMKTGKVIRHICNEESKAASESLELASSITCSPDGKKMMVSFKSGACDIWEIESGKRLDSFETGIDGLSHVEILPTKNQMVLANASASVVEIWDFNQKKRLRSIDAKNQ